MPREVSLLATKLRTSAVLFSVNNFMKPKKGSSGQAFRRRGLFQNVEDAVAVKVALNSKDGLSQEAALDLLGAQGPTCCEEGRKDLLRGNPTCLCGLIPCKGQSRKKGLWAKPTDTRDLAVYRKRQPGEPVGIFNLGNTCYMSSALQLMYSIPQVRDIILTCKPTGGSPEDQRVAEATKKLFGELGFSPLCATRVGGLAEALRLQTDIQQDPQEFMKLFQSLLEKAYGVMDGDRQGMFQTQFAGGTSYATRCKECGEFSSSSFDVHDFLDLQLQVGQHQTLEESLEAYTSPCQLTGNNKYQCETCKVPTDAERRVLIRKVPPRLQITLSRFDYDFENGGKKKIRSAVRIPLNLDLRPCLKITSDVLKKVAIDDMPTQYKLTCILHHLGASADSGHYVAQVCLPTGEWWLIDDDVSTLIGKFPEGNPNQGKKRPTDKEDRKIGVLTSNSAYICIYSRCGEGSSQTQKVEREKEDEAIVKIRQNVEEGVQKRLAETDDAWNVVVNEIDERQNFLRKCMDDIAVDTALDEDRWVASDWIVSCMDDEKEPSTMDNSAITCIHKKLDPLKISGAKRISAKAFRLLSSRHPVDVELSSRDLCAECLLPLCEDYLSANREAATRSLILEILKEGIGEDDDGYWVSKTWLQGWKKRGGSSTFMESPTSAIECRHNRLAPPGLAARVQIPPAAWDFFRDAYEKHQAGNVHLLDGVEQVGVVDEGDRELTHSTIVEFPVSCSQNCDQCSMEVNQEDSRQQAARDLARSICSNLPRLSSGSHIDIEPETTYYLWPKPWFCRWQTWLNSKGKELSEKPPPLEEVGKTLLCSCHPERPGITCMPPRVKRDRGKLVMDALSAEVWEIITEEEWKVLSLYHMGSDSVSLTPIKCSIVVHESSHLGKRSRFSYGGSYSPEIKVLMVPPPCDQHLTDQLVQPSTPFVEEHFEIVLVGEEAAARASSNDRASRRRLGRHKVRLSSTDTMHTLKLKIYEILNIALPNQRVFWDSMEILEDVQTLGNLGLRIGTMINVLNAKVIDDNDMGWLDDELASQLMPKRQRHDKETGFANTLLLGGF